MPEQFASAVAAITETDAADLIDHGPLLARFVADLGEALDQITIAGLAHPDPDVPDDLARLADRAARLHLATADAGLRALGAALIAVRAAAPPGELASPELTRAAADATQRLVTWRRLFARAFALERVEGRLAAEALVARGERPPRPTEPTASLRAWPLGFTLRDERLTITALDLATGGRVTIHDRVSDLDPLDPLGKPVISRLLQAAVPIARMMATLFDFDEHPVGRAHGGPLFGPAFRAVPRLTAIAPGLRPPPLPETNVAELERLRRPVQVTLCVERRPDGVAWTLDGAVVELEQTEVLALSAQKLLARAGAAAVELSVVLGPGGDSGATACRVLAAVDVDPDLDHDPDAETRIYPAHDPTIFRLGPAALFRRATAAVAGLDATDAAFVRTVAALHGGVDRGTVAGLIEGWRAPQPGLDAAFDAALLRRLTGAVADPAAEAQAVALVDDALVIGALSPRAVSLDALEALLGRPAMRGDGITGAHLFSALWLGLDLGLLPDRRSALLTLFAARYAGELRDPDPYDVAVRALLLAELSREAAEADEANGEEPLDEDAVLTPAREFFGAHLVDLGGDKPLPPLMALHALATTHALLHPPGPSPLMAPLMAWGKASSMPSRVASRKAAEGIAPLRLAHAIADALLDLDRQPRRAAEALLVASAAGLGRWFVG